MGYFTHYSSPKGVVQSYQEYQVTFDTDELWYAVYGISCFVQCDNLYTHHQNGLIYECYLCR